MGEIQKTDSPREDYLTSQLFSRRAIRASFRRGTSRANLSHLRKMVDAWIKERRVQGLDDKVIVTQIMDMIGEEVKHKEARKGELQKEVSHLDELIARDTFSKGGLPPGSTYDEGYIKTFVMPEGTSVKQTAGSIFLNSTGLDWDAIANQAMKEMMDPKQWEPRLDLPPMGDEPEEILFTDDQMADHLRKCSQADRLAMLDCMILAASTQQDKGVQLSDGKYWLLRGSDAKGINADVIKVLRWMAAPLVLQKQEGTHFHDMVAAIKKGDRFYRFCQPKPVGEAFTGSSLEMDAPLFHIEHDWAALFAKSSSDETVGIARLPFPHTAFEMMISGMRVCSLAYQITDDDIGVSLIAEFRPKNWTSVGVWESASGGPWKWSGKFPNRISWSQDLIDLVGAQYGASLADIRSSMTRDAQGKPEGVMGTLLDAIGGPKE